MYLLTRLQNILFSPQTEWQTIKREALTIAQLYGKYFFVYAALPSVGYLLGFLGGANFVGGLRLAIIGYVIWLLTFNFSAAIVDRLASAFASTRNTNYAFKLVSFSMLPMLAAGVLTFVPNLGLILPVIGLAYSAYVCYLGLPILLQTPSAKLVPFTAAVLVTVLVVYFGLLFVLSVVFGAKPWLFPGA